jgi:hypothetical protein
MVCCIYAVLMSPSHLASYGSFILFSRFLMGCFLGASLAVCSVYVAEVLQRNITVFLVLCSNTILYIIVCFRAVFSLAHLFVCVIIPAKIIFFVVCTLLLISVFNILFCNSAVVCINLCVCVWVDCDSGGQGALHGVHGSMYGGGQYPGRHTILLPTGRYQPASAAATTAAATI